MFPSAAELVASFLRANGYTETLDTFIREAGLAPDAGSSAGNITIDQILQEKKTFDLSLSFEKLGVDDKSRGWLVPGKFQFSEGRTTHRLIDPAPTKPLTVDSMPTKSNILSVSLARCKLPSMSEAKAYLAATTADRKLHLFDPNSPALPLVQSYSSFLDSPVLDCVVLQERYLLIASMSGRLLLFDITANKVLDERKDQTKYIVRLATWADGPSIFIATAGWDSRVLLYRFTDGTDNQISRIGEPIATLTLPSIPETLLFIRSPDTQRPILLLSRKDSTFIYYYSLPSSGETELMLLGRQNLAPHSNAWVAFSPSDIQLSPHDALLVAVATSSTPYMKLIIVRLLIPPESSNTDSGPDSGSPAQTQASQARADLLLQDREEAAMIVNVDTKAPQTSYSTPRLAWRPDGSGVYISSDDGIIRGFEATTGKRMATLEAHEPGSKIRCLFAGRMQGSSNDGVSAWCGDEFLLTGGFDQRLILWGSL